MSYVEFQIGAKAFLAAQLSYLQTVNIPSPPPVAAGGYQIVLDHVSFGQNSLRNSVTKPWVIYYSDFGSRLQKNINAVQVQIAQDVTLYLADLNDVLAHPNGSPSLLLPVTVTMVLNLDYFLQIPPPSPGWAGSVEILFDHLEVGQLPSLPPGIDPNTVQQQLQQLAQQIVPTQTLGQLNPAKDLLGGNPTIANAGVSVDEGLTRITFRSELGDGTLSSPDAWTAFYGGDVPDRLLGADWGVFVDGDVLAQQLFPAKVQGQLSGNIPSNADVWVEYGACTYSNPAPNRGHVLVQLGVIFHTGVADCNPYVEVKTDSDITVNQPNTLSIDGEVSYSIPGGDTCQDVASDIVNLTDKLRQIKGTFYSLTFSVPQNGSARFGTLAFTALAAQSDGLSLTGTMPPAAVLTPPQVNPSSAGFSWQAPVVSCIAPVNNADLAAYVQQNATLLAMIDLNDLGTSPLYLDRYSVQNDPLRVFQNAQIQATSPGSPIQVSVTLGNPGAQYYQQPYPFELLVFTNGGVRLISLGLPPPLTAGEVQSMVDEILKKVAQCKQALEGWFTRFLSYVPVWDLPDPPPGYQVDHLWQVSIVGLAEGETASMVDAKGQTIMTVTATPGLKTELSALTGPQATGAEISVVHAARPAAEVAASAQSVQRGIGVKEQFLILLSDIDLAAKCDRIGIAQIGKSQVVFAVMPDRLVAYDITVPVRPQLFGYWNIRGIKGALPWQSGLLAFGAAGFTAIAANGNVEAISGRAVLDAVVGLSGIVAAGNNTLDFYSSSFKLQKRSPANVVRLARLGNTLVTAESDRISFTDVGSAARLPSAGQHVALAAVDLAPLPDGNERAIVAVSTKGSSLLTLPGRSAPSVIATFAGTPWFLHAVRTPTLLARLAADASHIRLSSFGAAKTI